MGTLLYLDSSAIVKLAGHEPESGALRTSVRSWPEQVSSVIARVEVTRAARRYGPEILRRVETVIDRITLVRLDEEVVRHASQLDPPQLRTPDAIHLATALSLGDELGALCAYDTRLAEAAGSLGIDVISPA